MFPKLGIASIAAFGFCNRFEVMESGTKIMPKEVRDALVGVPVHAFLYVPFI